MLMYVGSGWTLVVTISSKSNDHLQSAEVHCFKPTLCVPFVEKNSDITARKSGDEDIPERMHLEDQSENVLIRVLLSTLCIRSAFYFCFCCKFKGRRLKVSMLIENLEVFGLHRFHYIWFFTFNLESKFFFSGTFRVDVLTRNVTYTVFFTRNCPLHVWVQLLFLVKSHNWIVSGILIGQRSEVFSVESRVENEAKWYCFAST